MIIRARVVVPMVGPPIENGAVLVHDREVLAVGPADEIKGCRSDETIDLGEMALLPGLINAHCHLDYSSLRYAISPPASFAAWVKRINAVKRTLTSEDYLDAIARGFRELEKWGTTTVCNVEAFPELMQEMPEPPIRTWWFYEMIDIRHRITTEEVVRGALSFFDKNPYSLSRYGLSPHAPYTASRSLYDLANSCAETFRMMLTTHVAESCEERMMFYNRTGPLYDFMSSLGRSMEDCGEQTPFARLWQSGAIHQDWLLVHMNELEESDFQLLASLPPDRKPHVVHCPGSHAYFRHRMFPFRRLKELGVNLSLGTDSLASTHSLSLFDEMRRLRANEPELTGHEVLSTVTLNPARALQRSGRLGEIAPGALADLIALPVTLADGPDSVYDAIVNYRKPVPWLMVDGKIRHSN
jgi:cytosine/adenosine deaminase-related metal-dependent hydrolase